MLRIKRDSCSLEGNIYQSERIAIPFTFGLFHPFIVVPKSISPEDYDLVLAHERTHIRRKDSLWKGIGFLALAFFWFNPFMWIAYRTFSGDIEMACDEAVSEKFSVKRSDYALSLLRFSSSSDIRFSSFGGKAVKKRIDHMLTYQRLNSRSFLRFLPALLLFLAVFLVAPLAVSASAEKFPEVNTLGDRILTESPVLYVQSNKGSSEAVMGPSSWHFATDKENWNGMERDIALDQIQTTLAQTAALEGTDFSLLCSENPTTIHVGYLTKQNYLHSHFFALIWSDISSLSFSVPPEAYLVVIYAEWVGDYCDGSSYYYFIRS